MTGMTPAGERVVIVLLTFGRARVCVDEADHSETIRDSW